MKILMLGCGNMGGAMLAGWLAGDVDPARFTVVDRKLEAVPAGATLLRTLPPGGAFDTILLGVKPQALDSVAEELAPLCGPHTTLLSILAGIELATLRARFPKAQAVVRVMPNLAAAIGRSPIVLASDRGELDGVSKLMQPLGTPEWLPDERQFDLVTALTGCGPGFVYRFIDALAGGAASLGLDPAQAGRLAVATVEGAAMLAAASSHSPGELARRVASPGGSTQRGLDVLDADDALARLIEATLRASRDRCAEMAAEARKS